MRRQHVHFAKGLPAVPTIKSTASRPAEPEPEPQPLNIPDELALAENEIGSEAVLTLNEGKAEEKVISGMRRDANVLVWVDVRRSLSDGGLQWWRSANGVILTEGDSHGMVSLDFVNRAEKRGGGILWEPTGDPTSWQAPSLNAENK